MADTNTNTNKDTHTTTNLVKISGDEMLAGRYVIVQMDNGEDPLNLKEVTGFGTAF